MLFGRDRPDYLKRPVKSKSESETEEEDEDEEEKEGQPEEANEMKRSSTFTTSSFPSKRLKNTLF